MKLSHAQRIVFYTIILVSIQASAKHTVANTEHKIRNPIIRAPAPLSFDKHGKFKILQLADLHFGENAWDDWGPQQDVESLDSMRAVLELEEPSLVVFSGDQITDNNINTNQTLYWEMVVSVCVEMGIPWATIFGNHDNMAIDADVEEHYNEQRVNTSTHSTVSTRSTLLQLDQAHSLSHTHSLLSTQAGESLSAYYLDVYGSPVDSDDTANATDTNIGIGSDTPSGIDPETATMAGNGVRSRQQRHIATRLWFMDSGGGALPLSVTKRQLDWLSKTAEGLADSAEHERHRDSINRRRSDASYRTEETKADQTEGDFDQHLESKAGGTEHRRSQGNGNVPGLLFIHAPPPDVKRCRCARASPSPQPRADERQHRKSNDRIDRSAIDAYNPTCFGMREDGISPFSVDDPSATGSASSLFGATVAGVGVKLVAFGHNHGNDFCCSTTVGDSYRNTPQHRSRSSQQKLGLCFGRHSGHGGYSKKHWTRGARVYVLDLSSEHVATHVRLEDGNVTSEGVIPDFFPRSTLSYASRQGNASFSADSHGHRHSHGSKASYVVPVVMVGVMMITSVMVGFWLRWNVRSYRDRKPEASAQIPMATIPPRQLVSDSVTSDEMDSDRLLCDD